jgi:hypothetical protein
MFTVRERRFKIKLKTISVFIFYIFKTIQIANRSISNLKSHLGRAHGLDKFLTPKQNSQIAIYKTLKIGETFSRKEQMEIHEKVVEAAVNDSCSFNVFTKLVCVNSFDI